MRIKIYLLFLLLLSNEVVFGKRENKTKKIAPNHKKHSNLKEKSTERIKRSLDNDIERGLQPNTLEYSEHVKDKNYDSDFGNQKYFKSDNALEKDAPFWGTRGRRDSSSAESVMDVEYPDNSKYFSKNCKSCNRAYKFDVKDRRDELIGPFWGNRGRRNSDELEDNSIPNEPFWGNRGRRQDQEPFWGNRGRRQEDSPFWGNRGRRESMYLNSFDTEEPFWSSRGRRDDSEPFWGNRGRREESEPFWGNRGRREILEPFWGSRGKKKGRIVYRTFENNDPFWGRDRKKIGLKNSILNAIDNIEDDIERLSRLKKSENYGSTSFWLNRGRDSEMRYIFNGPIRNRLALPLQLNPIVTGKTSIIRIPFKGADLNTLHDDRIYAEEPHYVIVDRSSRSSAEDDPFFISRGKKYNTDLAKAARGRRGAIEEIVKSVRNDPYYIARGKKDTEDKVANSSIGLKELDKAKDLVCATVDLLIIKNSSKVKREADNERDRRTILKKLAAQLQNDPYFVSRGKKNESTNDEHLEEFINHVADMCNKSEM